MKPTGPFAAGRKRFPQTDYFFHSGFGEWRGHPSPYDGEDRSEFRNFYNLGREFRIEAGNVYINRSCTGAVVGRHPFGGFKMSGGGTKAGGTDYLLQFLVPRVVTENITRHGFAPEETPRYRDEFLWPKP